MIRSTIFAMSIGVAAGPCAAEMVVPTGTIRAHQIIVPSDVKTVAGDAHGVLTDPSQAVGQEARVTLYAGRPIRPGDLAGPALIERNQIVLLEYRVGGLAISTDARALDRGGAGDRVRVMNVASRSTVVGRVSEDGTVTVTGGQP